MSESLSAATFEHSPITVSGPDPLRLVESLVARLFSLTSDPDHPEDVADAASIATFQAEATTIPELARGIVDDVLATIADSPTNVTEIELANLLQTDMGWRAWGYVRFGETLRRGAPPRIAVESAGAEAERPIVVRLLVAPAASTPSGAYGASAGDNDGAEG